MTKDLRDATQRKGSFAQTLKAVAWSFFGVRKSSDYAQDVSKLNPVHVVVAGVLAAVLFVVGLVVLVSWVISSGVAQ
jgi:amino acid transporter